MNKNTLNILISEKAKYKKYYICNVTNVFIF